MNVIRRRGWEISENRATPEEWFFNRRQMLKAAGLVSASILLPSAAEAQDKSDDPSAALYPAKRNETYKLDRPLTEERFTSRYNNFYEFGGDKDIWQDAQKLQTRPWMIKIDGMVEKPFEIGIDDLLKKVQLEERTYRLRCVEAWGMTIPWSGFPTKALLDIAKPTSSAKYMVMQTFRDPKNAAGQRVSWYPWPYTDGCTIEEAANELSFMVTGAYGKPAAKQFGAPMRIHQPWKFGFKAVKSIQRITFTDKRPVSFWQQLQAAEYGFWANVNPQVDHPRWSQATETVLGEGKRVPTLMWNGYGDFVADLYKGMEKNEKLFM